VGAETTFDNLGMHFAIAMGERSSFSLFVLFLLGLIQYSQVARLVVDKLESKFVKPASHLSLSPQNDNSQNRLENDSQMPFNDWVSKNKVEQHDKGRPSRSSFLEKLYDPFTRGGPVRCGKPGKRRLEAIYAG
jgi:hypothetical protein